MTQKESNGLKVSLCVCVCVCKLERVIKERERGAGDLQLYLNVEITNLDTRELNVIHRQRL